MKKVLIINTANTGFTGITNVILNYLRVTAGKVGYDFVLAGRIEEGFREKLLQYGENIFVPPCSRVKAPVRYGAWLKKLMVEHGYDAVHVHGNSGTMYFDIHAAKKAGIPVRVCHSHNSSCKFLLAHKLLRPLLNRELTDAIACSDKAGKWVFHGDFKILNNGVEVPRFRFDPAVRERYRRELGLDGSFVVGHVGQMEPVKNHAYLIGLFPQILKVRPEAKLMLVGDGSLRPQLEEQIKALGLEEKVLVLGKRADAAELYQCMDVFAMPSLFEGLPLVLVEAQAAGLYCVVSDAVTRQVDLVGNMAFVGIGEENREEWVKAVCGAPRTDRAAVAGQIEGSAFDINNCADTVLKIYGR